MERIHSLRQIDLVASKYFPLLKKQSKKHPTKQTDYSENYWLQKLKEHSELLEWFDYCLLSMGTNISPAERAAANQQHSRRAAEHAATPASPCL